MKSTYFALSLFLTASSLSHYASAQHTESRIRPVVPYEQSKLSAPPGMVYVPGGTTIIKYSQQASDSNSVKKVSLSSYFIDKTEVTNQQYRQFIEWVVDSIAITKYLKDEDKFFKDSKDEPKTAEVKPGDSTSPAPAAPVSNGPQRRINWAHVDHKSLFENDDYKERLKPMLDEKGQVKRDSIFFSFRFLRSSGTNPKLKVGTYATSTVNVYPDEEIWAKDFPNAQTDILVENYFTSEPYEDYPVVGVTWPQANAFTYWRSQNASSFSNVADYMKSYHLSYSLPSEAQWVYAAQQDMKAVAKTAPVEDKKEDAKEEKKGKKKKAAAEEKPATTDAGTTPAVNDDPNSSWTSTAAKTVDNSAALQVDSNALFLDPVIADENNVVGSDRRGLTANFKQDEGELTGDGSAFTVPVMSYTPNEFGIYCMSGNVAEWTKDAYSPSTFAFVSDVNPVLSYDADSTDGEPMRRKVIRGGSFNSPAKDLGPYARAYELQETAHSYIGFRCVMGAPEILSKMTATRKKSKKK
ncbi:SUMF1/EgtB/PvdO family nonheme iron enzyme [Flavipsychrobacter stenotrophus]|nr:SUMF1/EgtB/PvdO family nonheme iron enzyme [Flavipsychrobacter stenotrophus]